MTREFPRRGWPALLIAIYCALLGTGCGAAISRPVYAHYMVCCTLGTIEPTTGEVSREVDLARSEGIDGFALNIGAWTQEARYSTSTGRLFDTADAKGNFKLFLSADAGAGLTPEETVAILIRFSGRASYLKVGGKPVLSTYGADPDWSDAVLALLRRRGIAIYYVPHINRLRGNPARFDTASRAAFSKILADNPRLDGYFLFGGSAAGGSVADASRAAASVFHAANKIYVAPVTPYYRGHNGNNRVFDNAGFAMLKDQWRTAIDNRADWVEIVTWNDWGESTYMRPFGGPPVLETGFWGAQTAHDGFLDASAYYMQWFKTGIEPRITEDRVYVAYRPHPAISCRHDLRLPEKCPQGVESLQDKLYVAVDAIGPETLILTVGDASQKFHVPANGRFYYDIDLRDGAIKVDLSSVRGVRTWTLPIKFGEKNVTLNYGMIASTLK